MNTIRFGVYGDIHHASKAARCLTLDDTLEIEREFHNRAPGAGWDFTVFVGDRYLKREPEDQVKVLADRCLSECLSSRSGILHYHFVGNHDWTKNNREWHTSESLKYGFPNLRVLDTPGTTMAWLENDLTLAIHALPADVPFNRENYRCDPDPRVFDLFLFHGIVKGSLMSDNSDRVFEDGIDVSDLDNSEWQLVLGGDIHVPQTIPFTYTRGGYPGSILQRDRSDADKPRGWLEVTATFNGTVWDIQTEFVPTRNFFHKEVFEVSQSTQYTDLDINEDYVADQAVEVKLIGAREDVDRVAADSRWSNYESFLGARSLDVVREYKVEQMDAVVDLSQSRGASDDLEMYLESGFSNTGDLSPDKIFEMIERLRQEG